MDRSPDYPDHTYLRQEWALAPDRNPPDLPEQLRTLLARFPNDIRADTHGNLMLAHRNRREGIVGYDVIDLAAFTLVKSALGNGEGFGLFGPRDAETVIITSDARAAVLQAALREEPEPLIITVPKNLSPDSAHHLKELAEGRCCFIALDEAPQTEDFRAHLLELLPHARHRKHATDGLLWFMDKTGLEALTDDTLTITGSADETPIDPNQGFSAY